MLDHRLLFANDAFSALDVRCSCARDSWSAEETVEVTRLVLPRRGVFEHRARGRTTVAEPNRLLWFHPDQSYRVRHPVDGGDRCTAIGVGLEALREVAEAAGVDPARLPRLTGATVTRDLDAAHHELLRLGADPAADPLAVTEVCVRLAGAAIAATWETEGGDSAAAGSATSWRRLAERARLVLAERLDRSLGLRELASAVGCSPSHLCRAFRRQTGLSLGEYRQRLRIHTALDRLREGESDLTGLALDLGFFDHAHFTRMFRRHVGVPPSAWRGSPPGVRRTA